MRFRVTNIHPGYCEIWANERDGGRYQRLAVVMFDESRDDRRWHWSAKEEPPFFMPFYTYGFRTRRECINQCKKTALRVQLERAIESQPKESEHWHSPRRDALADMKRSNLFTVEEMERYARMACTFGEASA